METIVWNISEGAKGESGRQAVEKDFWDPVLALATWLLIFFYDQENQYSDVYGLFFWL